jgi:hypothetical protein
MAGTHLVVVVARGWRGGGEDAGAGEVKQRTDGALGGGGGGVERRRGEKGARLGFHAPQGAFIPCPIWTAG